uniref:Uncharacterized protein n=1 Tax=Anguilla anguilla TaxID=7936 RepID=A0A0E9PIY1_ANGAN
MRSPWHPLYCDLISSCIPLGSAPLNKMKKYIIHKILSTLLFTNKE